MCQVVNKYLVNMKDPDIVYIGRGSIWGNPISHKPDTKAYLVVGTVAEAIQEYRKWLWYQIKEGIITIDMLKALDGKRLACYCVPKPCHGNVIKQAVKWAMGLK